MNSRGSSPLPSHPTSSQVIPVWRGLQGIITNSSHIGVDLSDLPTIGVWLDEAARRKFAAPQTVIVSERCNRESNDLNRLADYLRPSACTFSQSAAPSPLCSPRSPQGHPSSAKIGRGSQAHF